MIDFSEQPEIHLEWGRYRYVVRLIGVVAISDTYLVGSVANPDRADVWFLMQVTRYHDDANRDESIIITDGVEYYKCGIQHENNLHGPVLQLPSDTPRTMGGMCRARVLYEIRKPKEGLKAATEHAIHRAIGRRGPQ